MKIFKEEQRFNQLWLIVILLVSAIVPISIYVKEYLEDPSKNSTLELFSLILIVLFATGFIFFFKLTTRIDDKGIHYKFFPFHWNLKSIQWNEIDKAYVRTYDPLGEYGGWGLKGGILWNKAKGKAINVSGDIGIQLLLKNGKKLLIGTQKENEAKHVLTTYSTKIN
ncbi:hypothetical protein [Winogradskyella psychrotolerans]|uniref:hypothetical protein n=1 Tax=Winogradskyella psychrotolerans TaxID=1344585 RepID=UPI001C076E73|nr:hypothetical protein [Winogradskyella psychrotolerans]MBU2928505.1 hypothetical protein [Winogradskyella psychrotolerans]